MRKFYKYFNYFTLEVNGKNQSFQFSYIPVIKFKKYF